MTTATKTPEQERERYALLYSPQTLDALKRLAEHEVATAWGEDRPYPLSGPGKTPEARAKLAEDPEYQKWWKLVQLVWLEAELATGRKLTGSTGWLSHQLTYARRWLVEGATGERPEGKGLGW
jgi:hypothetical protein